MILIVKVLVRCDGVHFTNRKVAGSRETIILGGSASRVFTIFQMATGSSPISLCTLVKDLDADSYPVTRSASTDVSPEFSLYKVCMDS